MHKNNNKQPSDNMRKRLEEVRLKIEQSTQNSQKKNGTSNVVRVANFNDPLEINLFPDAVEIITPELNIARHADFIFCSPKSKKVGDYREKLLKNPEGFIAVTPATTISFDGKKTSRELRTPTVTTARIFYAIVQIWEEQGRREDGWVAFEGTEIFKILNLSSLSQPAYNRIYREISVLKGSVIHWNQIFGSGDITTRTTEQLNFITSFKTRERTNLIDSKKNKKLVVVQIHPTIMKSIISGNVKPFLFREYLDVSDKSFDGAILYTKLDLYLSSRPANKPWKRRITELFKDLGIDAVRYKKSSLRLEKAQELANLLNGRRISRGRLKVTIVDGVNEFLLRAERIPEKNPRVINVHNNLGLEGREHLISEMVKWVGFEDKKQANGGMSLVAYYAMSYPEEVIFTAISRYKSDAKFDPKIRSKKAIFTAYLHREVHRHNLNWVGNCDLQNGAECKYKKDLFT